MRIIKQPIVIVGPSNCDKTNVMITLIESPNGLCFKNVYIYTQSISVSIRFRKINQF